MYLFILIHRFSIDRSTDQDSIFHIDQVSGAITLGRVLDRETAGWHNITVAAVEAGRLVCSVIVVVDVWSHHVTMTASCHSRSVVTFPLGPVY